MYLYSNDVLESDQGKQQKGDSLHGAKFYSVWHADIAHGENMFWHSAFHVGVGLSPVGFLGRKTDATIGFGLKAMHKVVLGPAQVIRQLENRAHSHSGWLSPSNG